MTHYRGRFAPSPTGPLHFGSLVAAAASYLDARASDGQWLVRMEDLDPPREMPGAASAILATLDAFGFEWDGEVMHQSTRDEHYAAALAQLTALGAIYPCGCTRREIADSALETAGVAELVYPGTCARGIAPGRSARALRVRVDVEPIAFDDALQGRVEQSLARSIGDFVVKRADGPFAYQLAVVVDDADQGITDIVRGADLLDSTPRQIHLQRLLGLPTPRYLHVPVVLDATGAKLSKQTLATAIDVRDPVPALVRAFEFLGLAPPADAPSATLPTLWQWAIANWDRARLPRVRGFTASGRP